MTGGIDIKTIFTALNAKYIHSSLALRSIKKYCAKFGADIDVAEFTINNSEDFIFSEIYKMKPDVIGFSCYIWNMEMILNIASVLRKILPKIKIIFGGPEVSYEFDYILENKLADIIIVGEGEKTAFELISFLDGKNNAVSNLDEIDGIAYLENDNVVVTKPRKPIELDEFPFFF